VSVCPKKVSQTQGYPQDRCRQARDFCRCVQKKTRIKKVNARENKELRGPRNAKKVYMDIVIITQL